MAKAQDNQGKGVSSRSGTAPPEEYRWQPGQSGNPAGRKTSGATQTEWRNAISEKHPTEDDLLAIIRDRRAPLQKRAAAEELLHTLMPRLSDYEPLIDGSKTLKDLEAAGVDTAVVKKVKARSEMDKDGNVVAVTREIELHNLAGECLDRIADRTEGKPTQAINLGGNLGMPTVVEFITPGTRGNRRPGVTSE
jgi:hypothetical protein